jgi:type II secretory pathway pseudopilin PulG
MKLRGQAGAGAEAERGYAMAALLVAMSVAAVLMTMAMPVWKQMSQREKEEELVFRGLQYTHALRLFQKKYANASPPNFDVLVEQRFLRKKYKDPITNDDFQPILAGQALPGTSAGQAGASGAQSASGPGATTTLTTNPSSFAQGAGRGATTPGAQTPGPTGGIIGVTSKSKDKSIRIYNGRSHYNEWAFINVQQVQAPGAGAPGTAAPGQRGQQPGQPGQNPFGGPGSPGQRGRGANPNGPGNPPPGRGFGPPFPPGTNPFQPGQPLQPIQPGTGRGRGN